MEKYDEIEIKWDLTGTGCADCHIIKNVIAHCFSVSYVFSFGIDELLESLLSFFEAGVYDKYAGNAKNISRFDWDNEGDYSTWNMQWHRDNTLEVRVDKFIGCQQFLNESNELMESLTFKCDGYEFIGTVCKAVKSVLQSTGLVNYMREWDFQPFPISQLILLNQCYEQKVTPYMFGKGKRRQLIYKANFEDEIRYIMAF